MRAFRAAPAVLCRLDASTKALEAVGRRLRGWSRAWTVDRAPCGGATRRACDRRERHGATFVVVLPTSDQPIELPPGRADEIPAIAVTGIGDEQERRRAIAAGYDVYVVKPFDPIELVDIVTRVLGRPAA